MSQFFPAYQNVDFEDDLVSLVSSERSTSKPGHPTAHNIFDISAPPYTNPPYHFSSHFNSTIPPLGSYEDAHAHNHHHLSRSRSRSRPPSIGPTRSRRGNSISSASPPPHSRPHIMIPPARNGPSSPPPPSAWYIPPTPDSIGHPQSLPYATNHYDDSLSSSFPGFNSPPSASAGNISQSMQDKQSVLANEKRRRRRESHNAVERRRRDNINEKITELATLIPECLLEGATPNASSSAQAASSPPAPDEIWGGLLKDDVSVAEAAQELPDIIPGPHVNAASIGGVIKANKGMILTKSVEYIRFLQQLITAQSNRNIQLENELRGIRGDPALPLPVSASSSGSNVSSLFGNGHAHTLSENGSAFSGSPLGDVQEEEDVEIKREDEERAERRRGRPRHRAHGDANEMDVDGDEIF
ncbi:HLH-domain-containing protein [Cylindrobasidium torrendii FP15055 ss-10]|uniref:HLH-domain-containing protein n=1 Tax=Cylindrobasidium torrendii FP15055 ss-10 TaxID=1314674 RepID=A0A0D7B350_9AGAR|nr:HLH-domain-containing protein [Cylindrobasidium torrendii FP15055 ss-10]